MLRRFVSLLEVCAVSSLLLFTLACGFGLSRTGGGGGGSISVSVSPGTATIAPGATQQFTATVSGTSNTAVTWQVNSVAGGNSQVGTISTSGLYMAPSVSSTQNFTVTAVSAADSSKSASATVTVSSTSTGVSVTISPTGATLASGATQQFTATVSGASDTSVQWQVNGTTGGSATVGTISTSGLYTAPTVSSSTTITVSAVSNADTTKSASATVTVNPASGTGVSISLSPTNATLAAGSTQQFTATVTGATDTSVSWSVDGVSGGDASVGTITSAGLYTAPSTAGTHTVTATANADKTQQASASVNIVSMTVSPQTTSVKVGGTVQYTATVQGTTDTSVTWSVDSVQGGNATVGTITAAGLYTAPSTTGTHTVTATSVALPSYSVNATVTVNTSGSGGDLSSINHIIFISQENRSFDTYFGKLNEYRAKQGLPTDIDGLPDDCSSSNSDWTVPCSAMNKSPDQSGVPTTPIYAFHLKTMCIENTSADWIVSRWDFNAENPESDTPLMDGYVISAASSAISTGTSDTQGIRAMGFYTGDDLTYMYWLASQFSTSDRMFSPEAARTQPNRYYMVGATSGGQAYPSGVTIKQKTIFDLLTAAGVTWKIYTPNGYTSAQAFSQFNPNGNVVSYNQFYIDAQNGTLPQVAYVEKPDADEHPGIGVDIQDGLKEVSNLVNAVMYGPSWKDSAMIITFDESGGLYDHVPPMLGVPNPDGIKPLDICTSSSDPRCGLASKTHGAPPYDPDGDFTRTGFRVPFLIVSPFAKPHYVSHTSTDYTSWMKLVETRFGLPNLNARDAWANDLTEYFDFSAPWATPPQNPPAVTIDRSKCYDSLP